MCLQDIMLQLRDLGWRPKLHSRYQKMVSKCDTDVAECWGRHLWYVCVKHSKITMNSFATSLNTQDINVMHSVTVQDCELFSLLLIWMCLAVSQSCSGKIWNLYLFVLVDFSGINILTPKIYAYFIEWSWWWEKKRIKCV